MRVLSLFDGISCARVALERAGVRVDSYTASEIDKYAIQISQKNYPDIIHVGDVKNIPHSVAPGAVEGMYDLLIGGSPCTDLSIAKKDRKGLRGDKSILFWEYVRILKLYKPKYFILENVASMPKEDKDIITKELGVEPIMINASLVSAQNRKRLFWVGRLVGEEYRAVGVSQPNDKFIFLKDVIENGEVDRDKSHAIDANYHKGANWEQYTKKHRRQLVLNRYETIVIPQPVDKGILLKHILEPIVDEKYHISKEAFDKMKFKKSAKVFADGKSEGAIEFPQGVDRKSLCLLASNPQSDRSTNVIAVKKDGTEKEKSNTLRIGGGGSGVDDKHNWDSIRVATMNSGGQGDRIYSQEGKLVELSANGGGRGAKTGLYQTDEYIVRKLTPVECERLQGLPDNYTEGISNSQRYKCLGNAFNVDVVAHILSFIPKEDIC